MNLPDVERLRAVPSDLWTALGRRFRAIGFTSTAAVPFAKLSVYTPDPRRAAMAKWHLRRVREPHAYAMRMLVFSDPITEREARLVLGDDIPLERLLASGLLAREASGIVCAFVVQLLADLYIVSDDLRAGGDAVMGASPSTKSLGAAVRPVGRAGRALDLGCGAGTLALAMAQKCDHVVATDVSPRSVDLARINAALNDLPNVECRVGDLFAPVQGEAFDLIACQPPFVAHEGEAGPTSFLFGGPRGDELPMRVVERVASHLAPGGSAFVMVEWPLVEGDAALDERIVGGLAAPELSVLLLQSTVSDIDEHCARYANVQHPGFGDDYERAALRSRDHFEQMRIRALQPVLTVARRGGPATPWTSTVDVGKSPMSRARIDAMFAARDLVAAGRPAMLSSRLRVPPGASHPANDVIAVVNMTDSVEAAVAHMAEMDGREPGDVETEIVDGVRDALLDGRLTIAPPG